MASKAPVITQDDFESWRDNTVTQAFFSHLIETKAYAHEQWVGILSGEVPLDPMATQLLRVELKAKCEFIDDVLKLELSDIEATDAGSEAEAKR